MKEFPDHEYKLTEDCKEFITKYITQMSPMLSSKMSLGRKKTVLKLLTGCISLFIITIIYKYFLFWLM